MSFTQGTASYFPIPQKSTAIDFEEYINKHELQLMVTECTKYFIRKPQLVPGQAFSELYKFPSKFSVQSFFKGESILLRPFNTFREAKINRLIFVINFSKIFESFEDKNGFDYLQLIKLLCSDFPREIVIQALTLHGQLEEELLLKKTYPLNVFCKSILFQLLFDFSELQACKTIDEVVPLIWKNLGTPYAPCPAAIYEGLVKMSPDRSKAVPYSIMPFKNEMFSFLTNGVFEYQQFVFGLFKNPKIDSQLQKLLTLIDKSNARILEMQNQDDQRRNKK